MVPCLRKKAEGKRILISRKAKNNLEHGLPSVSMDYAKVGNEDDGQAGKMLLIGREDWSGHTFCHVVDCNVLGDHHMLRKF